MTQVDLKEGAMNVALIYFGENNKSLENFKSEIENWSGLENLDLAKIVSTNNNYTWDKGLRSKESKKKNETKYSKN